MWPGRRRPDHGGTGRCPAGPVRAPAASATNATLSDGSALNPGISSGIIFAVTIPAGTLVPRDARDFGSYQLLAKLATGGMAEIYLARPTTSQGGSKDVMV